jgi:hypothetical protein
MGLLDLLHRAPAIADRRGLEEFLDRQAAFMVQKCIYEYVRARSGVLSGKLFKEAAFKSALEEARWRNYPLCLQNAALMVELALRGPAGGEAAEMRTGLAAAVGAVCRRYPVPAGFEPDFWDAAYQDIARRIAQAGLAAPRPVKDVPHDVAERFFANLPIHAELRSFDFELITNNLRLNLCRAHEDFVAAADLRALARDLVADGAKE